MQLTPEQQSIIENSLWVVNTALKKQGLQTDEDLRQSAILYMCRCILRFDPEKNIRWTTYAYKNVYLYIQRVHKKELQKRAVLIDDDFMSVVEPIADPNTLNEDEFVVNTILNACEPIERQILSLKMQGYKGYEIGTMLGISQNKLNIYMQGIKEKAGSMEL